MGGKYFLVWTALIEASTGLLLLVRPDVPIRLLIGVEEPSADADVVARIAGAALLSLALICWAARSIEADAIRRGLLVGVLIYDVGAAGILVHAAWRLRLLGIALWPGVALHATLALWCMACIWKGSSTKGQLHD